MKILLYPAFVRELNFTCVIYSSRHACINDRKWRVSDTLVDHIAGRANLYRSVHIRAGLGSQVLRTELLADTLAWCWLVDSPVWDTGAVGDARPDGLF